MARLKTSDISIELRTSLSQYSDDNDLRLAAIPTGRDPRRFTEADDFPQAVVQVCGTVTAPFGIGGGLNVVHGIAVFLAFQYENDQDINLTKLAWGEHLFEWLCENFEGENYQLFLKSADGNGMPGLDYEPVEEQAYVRAATPIALIKIEAAVSQRTTVNIRS